MDTGIGLVHIVRQHGGQVGNQQERRELGHQPADIGKTENIGALMKPEQDITRGNQPDFQQCHQLCQRQRGCDDGEQVEIDQCAFRLPCRPDHRGDEQDHHPGLYRQPPLPVAAQKIGVMKTDNEHAVRDHGCNQHIAIGDRRVGHGEIQQYENQDQPFHFRQAARESTQLVPEWIIRK